MTPFPAKLVQVHEDVIARLTTAINGIYPQASSNHSDHDFETTPTNLILSWDLIPPPAERMERFECIGVTVNGVKTILDTNGSLTTSVKSLTLHYEEGYLGQIHNVVKSALVEDISLSTLHNPLEFLAALHQLLQKGGAKTAA